MQYCYIMHFDFKHGVEHYVGYTTNPDQRIEFHIAGKSPRVSLVERAFQEGATIRLGVLFEGNMSLESYLQHQPNINDYCPICRRKNGISKISGREPHQVKTPVRHRHGTDVERVAKTSSDL